MLFIPSSYIFQWFLELIQALQGSSRHFDGDKFTLMLYQHPRYTAQLTFVSRVLLRISGEHLCFPFVVNASITPGTATQHFTERRNFPQNQSSKSKDKHCLRQKHTISLNNGQTQLHQCEQQYSFSRSPNTDTLCSSGRSKG